MVIRNTLHNIPKSYNYFTICNCKIFKVFKINFKDISGNLGISMYYNVLQILKNILNILKYFSEMFQKYIFNC